ncbi:MAG: transporter substrate-binding domain-containing protein [Bacteroidales bacterium]|nr:transporter substrate-binding domain-containing protein [Bacteroidales bacterium]
MQIHIRKRTILLIASVLLIAIAIPCLTKGPGRDSIEYKDSSGSTITRIKQRGVLLVGTTGDYRPLSFLEEDGSYWGFDIELAEIIAKELGVEVKFVPTSWPTLSSDVLSDPQKFDLAISGITITDQRLETMAMSQGYLANGKTILCRAEDAEKFHSIEDINRSDVRVMVNPGGTNEQFAMQRLTHASITVHPRNEEIPNLIAEGKADIMITEITEVPYYISSDNRLSAPLKGTPFTQSYIGILMRCGQEDLLKMVNDKIENMKNDGSLAQLHKKYGLVYSF